MIDMKTCSKCRVRKSNRDFGKNASASDGFQNQCKKCRREYAISDRSKIVKKPYQRAYMRRARLKKFDLTLADYDQMWALHNGRCAICRAPETSTYRETVRYLAVDHDHETGKVRGLLCAVCNIRLGHLEAMEKSGFIEKAREYLEVNE